MKEKSSGAIIYTLQNDHIRYLLIHDFHNNWGFPKGHLEAGETETEAALREICEEVGLQVRLDPAFREELCYVMPNGIEKSSIYFIAFYEDQEVKIQPEEVQETALLNYEEAITLLSFNNMKEVLARAHEYILKNR